MRYPQMKNTEDSSAKWVGVVRGAFAKSDGSAKGVGKELAGSVGSGLAAALVEGIAELVAYAGAAWGDEANAIDAEEAAVVVSRRIVRPVLEAKLQARLDALDEKCAGLAACPVCKGVA